MVAISVAPGMTGLEGGAPWRASLTCVCPAWARSWRCKSSRKLTTASEGKHNCARATERGEEVWNVNRESRNTNRISGDADQGERAHSREALVVKGQAA